MLAAPLDNGSEFFPPTTLQVTDVKGLRVVPYKSSAESTAALLGGHLDVVSATTPNLLPPRYTGFVARDNAFYRPIRDAGLATGKLAAQ